MRPRVRRLGTNAPGHTRVRESEEELEARNPKSGKNPPVEEIATSLITSALYGLNCIPESGEIPRWKSEY